MTCCPLVRSLTFYQMMMSRTASTVSEMRSRDRGLRIREKPAGSSSLSVSGVCWRWYCASHQSAVHWESEEESSLESSTVQASIGSTSGHKMPWCLWAEDSSIAVNIYQKSSRTPSHSSWLMSTHLWTTHPKCIYRMRRDTITPRLRVSLNKSLSTSISCQPRIMSWPPKCSVLRTVWRNSDLQVCLLQPIRNAVSICLNAACCMSQTVCFVFLLIFSCT